MALRTDRTKLISLLELRTDSSDGCYSHVESLFGHGNIMIEGLNLWMDEILMP